eukprot:jgi/Chrzof1/760/Cz01g27190.t1
MSQTPDEEHQEAANGEEPDLRDSMEASISQSEAEEPQQDSNNEDHAPASQSGQRQRTSSAGSVYHHHGGQHEQGDISYRSTGIESVDADTEAYTISAQASSVETGTSSRPMSGIRFLRGSRPNSAAIAATIEGFDNDFKVALDTAYHLHEVPEADHTDEEKEEDHGPSTEELIARGQQEQQLLLQHNDSLQKRARAVLEQRNKGRPAVNRDLSRLEGADARYRSALKQWCELQEERERVDAHYHTTVFDMKAALEERIRRAEDIAAAFKHFKREVALAAEHTKTGKPIPSKQLRQLEMQEQVVEEDVQRVRLKNIHLANTLKKLEATIRSKEELAEGLHLIDFEQLKIENQSLNEKIEERNEELVKLRKKTTTTVQILTHMKEKLQFVEKENEVLTSQLQQLESSMASRRDTLTKLKTTRDTVRARGRAVKDGSTYVANQQLLDDYEAQKEMRDELMAELEQLKQHHAEVSDRLKLASFKLTAASDSMLNSPKALSPRIKAGH